MPDFLTGDELGNIRSLRYSPNATSGSQTELKTLRTGKIVNGKPYAVQALALSSRMSICLFYGETTNDRTSSQVSLQLQMRMDPSSYIFWTVIVWKPYGNGENLGSKLNYSSLASGYSPGDS